MLRIVRYVLVVVLIAFIVVVYHSNASPAVSFQEVEAAYTESGLLDGLDLQNARQLERYLGITPEMYEEAAYWKAANPMSADELLIIRAKDEQALAAIEECVENRVNDQTTLFGDYAPEEAAKLADHISDARGIYYVYGVGDAADEWDRVFNGIQ